MGRKLNQKSRQLPLETEKPARVTLSESSTSSSPLELATMNEMMPESSGLTESMSKVEVKQLRELSAWEENGFQGK